MRAVRDFNVYPVWIVTEPRPEYAKVRTTHASMKIGDVVSVQRTNDERWHRAQLVDQPPDRDGQGHMVWLRLLA